MSLIYNNTSVCEGCPNNPKNNPFASGVCNCALPYMIPGGKWGDYEVETKTHCGWSAFNTTDTTTAVNTNNYLVVK